MDILALSLLALATENVSTTSSKLINFLEDLHKVGQFQSVLVLKNSNESFGDEFGGEDLIKDISTSLRTPMILSTDTNSFTVKEKFQNNILTIVNLNPTSDEGIRQRLVTNLRQMRSCKTIFLLNYPSVDVTILNDLFSFSWKNHMLNVLAIFADFSNTSTFYRYSKFPEFLIEEHLWTDGPPSDGYFPDRMRDLKGHELPVIFGGSEPKMIISHDKRGEPIIRGYAGHLFMALAKKHNANVSNPKIDTKTSAPALALLVLNNTFDISAATTFPETRIDWFTYPYENIDWCLVVPVEASIPVYEVFMIVFQWDTLLMTIAIIIMLSALLETATYLSGRKTFLLNYFFNDNCLRGALGQSFLEIQNATYNIKLIYLLICLIGIIMVTSYDAFLQTYITSPPSQKPIETYDDLLASGMKVYALRAEYESLIKKRPIFKDKYSEMFALENDFNNYTIFRDRLDPKYAYAVNDVRWIMLQELQKFFSRPLFRQPEGRCFRTGVRMAFPINENSIYLDILNFVMLEAQSSGLLGFWKRRSFFELVEIGRLKLVDLTSKPEFVPLKVHDLQLIWIGMGVAAVLVTMCFVGEICTFKWKARRERKQHLVLKPVVVG